MYRFLRMSILLAVAIPAMAQEAEQNIPIPGAAGSSRDGRRCKVSGVVAKPGVRTEVCANPIFGVARASAAVGALVTPLDPQTIDAGRSYSAVTAHSVVQSDAGYYGYAYGYGPTAYTEYNVPYGGGQPQPAGASPDALADVRLEMVALWEAQNGLYNAVFPPAGR